MSGLNFQLSGCPGQTAQHRLPLTFLLLFPSREKEEDE
jgi:hypothetical protein